MGEGDEGSGERLGVLEACVAVRARGLPGDPVGQPSGQRGADSGDQGGDDLVQLTATNPTSAPAAPVPGRGLNGIRHRAGLIGGSSTVDVRDGVFAVHVQIPTRVHA